MSNESEPAALRYPGSRIDDFGLKEFVKGQKDDMESVEIEFPVCVDLRGNVYGRAIRFVGINNRSRERMESAAQEMFDVNIGSPADFIHWVNIRVPIPKRPKSVEIVAEVEDERP